MIIKNLKKIFNVLFSSKIPIFYSVNYFISSGKSSRLASSSRYFKILIFRIFFIGIYSSDSNFFKRDISSSNIKLSISDWLLLTEFSSSLLFIISSF